MSIIRVAEHWGIDCFGRSLVQNRLMQEVADLVTSRVNPTPKHGCGRQGLCETPTHLSPTYGVRRTLNQDMDRTGVSHQ